MMKQFVTFLALLMVPFSALNGQNALPLSKAASFPGQLVIKVKENYRGSCRVSGIDLPALTSALSAIHAAEVVKKFPRHESPQVTHNRQGEKMTDLSRIYTVRFNANVPVEKAINALMATGTLEYAEPEYIMELLYNPNDPDTASQYYLGLIRAYDAWNITLGDSNFVVGVTDTGSDMDHPDQWN
jgi:serine protease